MDFLLSVIEYVKVNWLSIVNVIAYVITGASVIVKLTPSKADDMWLEKIVKVLKALSLNK